MNLNPPSPQDPSNLTVTLNLQTHGPPKPPRNPFNPLGVDHTQSAGLNGPSFYTQTFSAERVPWKRKLVFLIMSFLGDGMEEVLATLRDECDTLGFNATRVDDTVGSDFVIKHIWRDIQRAELIICDLTYERPNVYYELGYAHGVGNTGGNILLIAREGATLHFDIGPLMVHHYSSMESLRAILRKNLPEMHRVTTLKQASSSQPVDPAP